MPLRNTWADKNNIYTNSTAYLAIMTIDLLYSSTVVDKISMIMTRPCHGRRGLHVISMCLAQILIGCVTSLHYWGRCYTHADISCRRGIRSEFVDDITELVFVAPNFLCRI